MSRVALIGDNTIEYVDILLKIWNMGDCAVLIDWRIPLITAVDMMQQADVNTCYIERKYFPDTCIKNKCNIDFITFEVLNKEAQILPIKVREQFKENYTYDEALVIYSSGTTGKSKGVILSHYAINTNADAVINYMKLSANDCFYIAKTLSHSSTITGELLVALKSGVNTIIAPVIVPPRYVFENIQRFSVSIICVNPSLLRLFSREQALKQYKLASLKTIYVSGAILDSQTYIHAHTSFKDIAIYNVYGLSELAPRVTAQTETYCKSNSVGKPINGVELAIVNDYGEIVKTGECGIVHVNSPSLFSGYISGSLKYKSLYKNWLNTGDVGYIDENNELHINARIDDLIIINSHKIYPVDVENIILEVSDIAECAISKISYDAIEIIGCLYVGDNDFTKKFFTNLRLRLAPYEVPRFFINCKSLPKSLNGKLLRNEVNKILENSFNQNNLKSGLTEYKHNNNLILHEK